MVKSETVTVTAEEVVPKPTTSLTCEAEPSSGVAPLSIRVSGSLIEAEYPYHPIPYKSINVYRLLAGRPVEEMERIGMPSTMDDGTYYLDYVFTEAGFWYCIAEFEGDDYEGCWSDWVLVRVEEAPPPKKHTSLSIDVSPKSGVVPLDIRVSGSLIEADYPYYPLPYMSINVYMNGTLIGTPSTMDDGTWYLDYTITEVGVFEIYAEFEGTAEYEGCEESDKMEKPVSAWGCEN